MASAGLTAVGEDKPRLAMTTGLSGSTASAASSVAVASSKRRARWPDTPRARGAASATGQVRVDRRAEVRLGVGAAAPRSSST